MNYPYFVLFLPLLTALIVRLSAGKLSKGLAASIACAGVGASFVFAALSFFGLRGLDPVKREVLLPVFKWLSIGQEPAALKAGHAWASTGQELLRFDLLLDPLSAVMLLVVTGVGFLIHVYSSSYMHEENEYEYARYFGYLNFFVFSMLTLVLAANFIVLFIGWELVGVSSYLLIGYFRTKDSAADAGKKAFIVNRVGDFGFILAIFIILGTFGTADFMQVFAQAEAKLGKGTTLATVTALLLFMGAMGKSAQLPLHVWLPDAMEGPTPVSALIHAATMVTAGVFMVARCHAIFQLSDPALATIAWLGAATALFAATIALVQNDIKRVMAYSTLSQLGYMMMGVGVGAYTAGFFHLFTHAFFKALLFLGCGSVMHALHGELDMTRMGGLKSRLPITFWTFLIGSACLIGLPGTSGFFSKDEILYQALHSPHGGVGLWLVGVAGAACTAFYVSRLFFKTFYGKPRDHHAYEHAHESDKFMAAPLVILAALSLIVSVLGLPHLLVHGFQGFEHWLAPVFKLAYKHEHPSGPAAVAEVWRLIALYSAIGFGGIALGWYWFARESQAPNRIYAAFSYVHQILWKKYYVDELYDLIFVKGFLGLCRLLFKYFERLVIDGAVNGLGRLSLLGGRVLSATLATGQVRVYAGALIFGAVLALMLVLRSLR